MRKIALLLAGLICSVSVHAELVTFEYTGIINTLSEGDTMVVSSDLVPGGARAGDAYHGKFTLDTGLPRSDDAAGTATYFDWTGATSSQPTEFVMDTTGTSISPHTLPTVIVSNDTSDSLIISPGYFPLASFTLNFFDINGAALSGLGIPVNFDLNAWSSAEANIFWYASDYSKYVLMNGMLTSITRVSAVPEPTSYALFFAGIALVSGVAARKRKQAA